MISLILLGSETAGNVGAIARVMKNFDIKDLILVNPFCDHLSTEARNRAKHSQDVLENATVCDKIPTEKFDYLIATTARTGTDYNITRSPLTPNELAEKICAISDDKQIGLVIGREGHGMYNSEIEQCDFVVTIPSSKNYPTLNISHATTILLYELFKKISCVNSISHITPIGKAEKDQVINMFYQIFDKLIWETADKKQTQQKLWKKIIGKSMLTRRESYGVMGFLRKIMLIQQKVSIDKKTVVKKKSKNNPQQVKQINNNILTHSKIPKTKA